MNKYLHYLMIKRAAAGENIILSKLSQILFYILVFVSTKLSMLSLMKYNILDSCHLKKCLTEIQQ